jgi:hypothetical protein
MLAGGCQPVHYRSETELHADGTVERAIYQALGGTPEAILTSDRWQQTTYAPDPEALDKIGWPTSIKDFPKLPRDGKHPYFAAWGRFDAPGSLPDHLAFKAPEGTNLPAGRLVRDCGRTDFVFVVEHRWKETLTDCVRWDDMKKARAELADLMTSVGKDVFDELYGKDYDASGLYQWARTEGTAWFGELSDAYFLYCAASKRGPDRAGLDELAAMCARHGLRLKEGGQFLPNEALNRRLEGFALQLAAHHVRTRDGKPLDPAAAAALFKQFQADGQSDKGQPSRLEQASTRILEQKYGGKKAFERRGANLATRVVGLYFLVGGLDQLHYTLTMPGEVVETNGQVLAGNRVRWEFSADLAYPLGYAMECRSLAPDTAMHALLPGRPLAGREALLEFVTLVEGKEALLKVLQECRRQKDVKPLLDYRRKLAAANNLSPERKAAEKLLRLLKLS